MPLESSISFQHNAATNVNLPLSINECLYQSFKSDPQFLLNLFNVVDSSEQKIKQITLKIQQIKQKQEVVNQQLLSNNQEINLLQQGINFVDQLIQNNQSQSLSSLSTLSFPAGNISLSVSQQALSLFILQKQQLEDNQRHLFLTINGLNSELTLLETNHSALVNEYLLVNRFNLVEQFIKNGYLINVSNQKFETLIDKVAGKNNPGLLATLIEKCESLSQGDYDKWLIYCLFAYKKSVGEREKQAVLDYTASRLLGGDAAKLIRETENRLRYLAHLESFNGKKNNTNLEGMYHNEFMRLRTRTFLEMLMQLVTNPLTGYSLQDRDNRIIKLKDEIYHGIETVRIANHVKAIEVAYPGYTSQSAQQKAVLYRALAKNISRQLQQLPDGGYLAIESGWETHSLYIYFIRLRDTIIVRIDNCGSNCPNHHAIDSNNQIYPALLTITPVFQFTLENTNAFNYLVDILEAASCTIPKAQATKKIYGYNTLKPLKGNRLSHWKSTPLQTVGNCTAYNATVGLTERLGDDYLAIANLERRIVVSMLVENYIAPSTLWGDEKKPEFKSASPFLALISPAYLLKKGLEEYYEKHIKIMCMASNQLAELETIYRSLMLTTRQPDSVDLSLSMRELANKEKVLIVGDSGTGKTTLCKHIFGEWLAGRFKSECQLAFYIQLDKLQGLTSCSVASIIYDFCLSELDGEQKPSVAEIQHYLDLNRSQVLFIIDGCDHNLKSNVPVKVFLNKVMQYKHAIIATIPETEITDSNQYHFDLMVENKGFQPSEVALYIKQRLSKEPERAKSLHQYLVANPKLEAFALIPVYLEILCSAWEAQLLDESSLTLTDLYKKIIDITLARNKEKNPFSQNALIEKCLAQMAFYKLSTGTTVLTKQDTESFCRTNKVDKSDVIKAGILINEPNNPHSYLFKHSSIDEYLAAHFIVMSLQKGKKKEEIIKFTSNKENFKNYPLLWRFVSGLTVSLTHNENKSVLYKEVITLIQSNLSLMMFDGALSNPYFELFMRCLNEAKIDTIDQSYQNNLNQLCQLIVTHNHLRQGEEKYQLGLFKILKTCPFILKNEPIQLALLDNILTNNDEELQASVANTLALAIKLNPDVNNKIFIRLKCQLEASINVFTLHNCALTLAYFAKNNIRTDEIITLFIAYLDSNRNDRLKTAIVKNLAGNLDKHSRITQKLLTMLQEKHADSLKANIIEVLQNQIMNTAISTQFVAILETKNCSLKLKTSACLALIGIDNPSMELLHVLINFYFQLDFKTTDEDISDFLILDHVEKCAKNLKQYEVFLKAIIDIAIKNLQDNTGSNQKNYLTLLCHFVKDTNEVNEEIASNGSQFDPCRYIRLTVNSAIDRQINQALRSYEEGYSSNAQDPDLENESADDEKWSYKKSRSESPNSNPSFFAVSPGISVNQSSLSNGRTFEGRDFMFDE